MTTPSRRRPNRRVTPAAPAGTGDAPARLAAQAVRALAETDPDLYRLLAADLHAQAETLSLLPTGRLTPAPVLAAAGSAIANVPAQGLPGRRLNAGCGVLDAVERLAVERAKKAFGAQYADVQPHSGSTANRSVYLALLQPGQTVLCLDPAWGGQRAHGSPTSATGRNYKAVSYGLNGVGRIDYERLAWLAEQCRPELIVCSPGANPRTPDYARFRAIADDVGAYLLADISQVAGLVAAGVHPNPIDHAHVTTCCTSTVGGFVGGLILMGADAGSSGPGGVGSLRTALRFALFPTTQGAPNPAALAAKAAALRLACTPEVAETAARSVANAQALATHLLTAGHEVLGHGTDNHAVWLNVMSTGVTGRVAERALESCGILLSRNRVPFDVKPAQLGSGIRLGTTVLTQRGMTPRDMPGLASLIDRILGAIGPKSDTEYQLPDTVRRQARKAVAELCRQFPLTAYPFTDESRSRFSEAA